MIEYIYHHYSFKFQYEDILISHKKNINTSGLDSSIVIKINIMFKFGPDANIDIHILTIILI